MNFKLLRVGTIRAPQDLTRAAASTVNKKRMAIRGISQSFLKPEECGHLTELLAPLVGLRPAELTEQSILAFKAVETHQDDWDDIRCGRNLVKPGFLQVVLQGSFDLLVGSRQMTFKKGDVFLLNPNVKHCVPSKKFAITACFTVPAIAALRHRADVRKAPVVDTQESSPL